MTSELDQLRAQIIDAHADLPPQLKRIAQFVLDHPQQAALMRLSDMGAELEVQPSAVIRFSKAIGFPGFSSIQRILKADLAQGLPASYFERLRGEPPPHASKPLARFADLAQRSLASLPNPGLIDQAVQMLCEAETVHVLGLRRSFGPAAYFSYLLASFDAQVNQIEFLGHMNQASLSTLRPGHLLFLISFPTYSPEVLEAKDLAKERGAKTLVLTDSAVSPVAQNADLVLVTDQATDRGFRSAVGSMVTIQALAMAFGEQRADEGRVRTN